MGPADASPALKREGARRALVSRRKPTLRRRRIYPATEQSGLRSGDGDGIAWSSTREIEFNQRRFKILRVEFEHGDPSYKLLDEDDREILTANTFEAAVSAAFREARGWER